MTWFVSAQNCPKLFSKGQKELIFGFSCYFICKLRIHKQNMAFLSFTTAVELRNKKLQTYFEDLKT